jgi:hypothetical protein
MSTEFISWAVFEKPLDFPDKFVARKFVWDKATTDFFLGDSLDEVHQQLPAGLTCIPRLQGDPDYLVETWL